MVEKRPTLAESLVARSIFLSSVRRTLGDRSFVARMPRSYANTATSFSWINADRHRAVARPAGFLVTGSHYRAHQEPQHESPNNFVRSFARLHEREYNLSQILLLLFLFLFLLQDPIRLRVAIISDDNNIQ